MTAKTARGAAHRGAALPLCARPRRSCAAKLRSNSFLPVATPRCLHDPTIAALFALGFTDPTTQGQTRRKAGTQSLRSRAASALEIAGLPATNKVVVIRIALRRPRGRARGSRRCPGELVQR